MNVSRFNNAGCYVAPEARMTSVRVEAGFSVSLPPLIFEEGEAWDDVR